MQDRIYLLSVAELAEAQADSMLWQQVFSALDENCRRKTASVKTAKKRASSAGTGLLLQWHLQQQAASCGGQKSGICERGKQDGRESRPKAVQGPEIVQELDLHTLLEKLSVPLTYALEYGAYGKPYWKENQGYFNLSHSENYVAAVFSDCEAGIDIQYQKPIDYGRIARRFFSEEEQESLRKETLQGDDILLFYRLWSRKEAYGKCTGRGVASALGKSFCRLDADWLRNMSFVEYDGIEGYVISCCKQRRDSVGVS